MPLPAARIRELYARNPTTMAWEIWRLQRVIEALEAGLRSAGGLRNRQDIIDRVAELQECVAGEPCLNEALAVKAGARPCEQR
ncbi:hypothetical protein D3C86_867530 [compost metagenome]